MQDLVIFGAGGMGREVAALVREINGENPVFRHIAYAVDDVSAQKSDSIRGIPVFSREWLIEHRDDVVCACAIGYPKVRRDVQKSLVSAGVRFVSLLHPTTKLGEGTTVGIGCIFQQNCFISVDCRLGDGILLNGDVSIGHDSVLEDFVTCFPRVQLSGNVRIGEAVCMGSVSFVNQGRKVGAEAVVAPGSFVFRNVREGTHVMGNPAKRIEL